MYEKPKNPYWEKKTSYSVDKIKWIQKEENTFDFYRDDFYRKTRVDIDKINHLETLGFLVDWKEGDEDKRKRLIKFVSKYKEIGISSFVLDIIQNNSENILKIGESLEEDKARIIFQKISEIAKYLNIMHSDKYRNDFLWLYFTTEERKNIYRDEDKTLRINQIILELKKEQAQKIQNILDEICRNTGDSAVIDQITNDLKGNNSTFKMFSLFLKELKKQEGALDLAKLRGLDLPVFNAQDVESVDGLEEKIKSIYQFNQIKAGKSESDIKRIDEEYEKHKSNNARFHLIFFDENEDKPQALPQNLIGFVRSSSFDGEKNLLNNKRYIGALNLDILLQGSNLGKELVKKILDNEFSSGAERLIAHVMKNGTSHALCKKLGFKDVAQEGEYKKEDGSVLSERIRIELTKKPKNSTQKNSH